MKNWIMELCPEIAEWQADLIAEECDKAVAKTREAVVLAQGEPRIYGAAELAQMLQRGRDMHTRPAPVNQQSVRVGHLQISRHQTSGIWLRHDSGEAMQTDEDKLYQHLSEYWNKEF